MLISLFILLLPMYLASNLCGSFGYDNVYFDLNSGQTTDSVVEVTFTNGVKGTLYYNLCNSISEVCSLKTTLDNGTIQITDYAGPATLVLPSGCIPFTSLSSSNLYDTSNLSSSYVINYTSVPVTLEGSVSAVTYTLMLVNPCNHSLTNNINDSIITVISSHSGCPVLDLTTIWSYFDNHKFAFFLTTLIFGCIMMVLGIYMYRISIWLVGGLAGFGILLLIESVVVFLPGVPNSLINSILIITGVTSVFIGYVTLYFPKLGTFGLGAWIGVILSFILNNIFLFRIKSSISTLPLLITLGVLGIAFGVLAVLFKKSLVIISTSFIGAYCSIRALSWYLGAFPNQFLISKQRHYLGMGVQWQYYVYVVALLILAASSMAVQFWLFRKRAKLLGKTTNVDEYINQINEEINLERSKYLVFENVFKKKRKSSVEPRYINRRKGDSNSQSNYSSEQNSEGEESQQQQEQSEQQYQMKQIPKKIVKFEKANVNRSRPVSKTSLPKKPAPKKQSSSERSDQNSLSHSMSQSEEEQQRNYRNNKKKQKQKQPETRKSLKQKLLPKQQGRRN